MSEDRTDNLKKARARLIEQRRAFVKVLAGPYERGKTEQARERLPRNSRANTHTGLSRCLPAKRGFAAPCELSSVNARHSCSRIESVSRWASVHEPRVKVT